MRRLVLLALVAAGLAGCRREDGNGTSASAAHPDPGTTVAEQDADEEPLLLDDLGAQDVEALEAVRALDSRCLVCHANFETEKLVTVHALNEVGCPTCHGNSDAHCSDEDNITPPDVMHPREKIGLFCQSCHLELTDDHDAYLSEDKTCTECHDFEHRLAHRTRRWDRHTGKLLMRDGTELMTEDREP